MNRVKYTRGKTLWYSLTIFFLCSCIYTLRLLGGAKYISPLYKSNNSPSDRGSCANLKVVQVLQKLFQAYLLGLSNFTWIYQFSSESLSGHLLILRVYTVSGESFTYWKEPVDMKQLLRLSDSFIDIIHLYNTILFSETICLSLK